jgi:Transmembrane domain of unknown function (DUF3566)
MYRITRFNVIKTSNVVAVIYMVIVAIFVVPFLLLGFLFGATRGSEAQQFLGGGLIFGVVAILGYGLFGWIFTAIACLIYNLAARWVGGVEVQVEPVAPPPPPPAWMAPTAPPSPPVQPPG